MVESFSKPTYEKYIDMHAFYKFFVPKRFMKYIYNSLVSAHKVCDKSIYIRVYAFCLVLVFVEVTW